SPAAPGTAGSVITAPGWIGCVVSSMYIWSTNKMSREVFPTWWSRSMTRIHTIWFWRFWTKVYVWARSVVVLTHRIVVYVPVVGIRLAGTGIVPLEIHIVAAGWGPSVAIAVERTGAPAPESTKTYTVTDAPATIWDTLRSNWTVAVKGPDPLAVKLWYQYPLTVVLATKFECTSTRPFGFPPAACHSPKTFAPLSQSA